MSAPVAEKSPPFESTDAAFALARKGFAVFPLLPGQKRPALGQWQQAATSDVLWVTENWPAGHNVGISTTGLVVIDVDAGKGGLEELTKLGELPPTFTVRSARGGLHLYFKPDPGEKFQTRAHTKSPSGAERFAIEGVRGVDVRAEGGLIVGPGSVFEGKPYTIALDAPVAPLPRPLADLLRAAHTRAVALAGPATAIGEVDNPAAVEAARAYLETAEPAIEGQGGDNQTVVVANRAMDFGVSPEMCASLMSDAWDDRCSPPWGLEALQLKCASAARSRQSPIGRDRP